MTDPRRPSADEEAGGVDPRDGADPGDGTDPGGIGRWAQSHGRRDVVGASRPLELHGDNAWYVVDGAVDLFIQRTVQDRPARRHPVGTVGSGGLVWVVGRPALPEGWRVLAVGNHPTCVVLTDGTTLRRVAAADELARHVEAFAAAVGAEHPSRREPASDGDPLAGAASAVAAALDAAVRRIAADEARHLQRLDEEARRQDRRLSESLAGLVDIVARRPRPDTAPDDQVAQLDLALARIRKALGLDPIDVAEWTGRPDDLVRSRVQDAGLRSRVVRLSEGWWRQSGKPLLGFVDGGRRPVALLPGRRGYEEFDPSTGTTSPLDADRAARVGRDAHVLYRTLPAQTTSFRGLVLPSLRFDRRELAFIVGLGALAGLVTLLVPFVTSIVYDDVLPQGDHTLLLTVALLLVGASVTWGLVSLSGGMALVRMTGKLQGDLEPAVFDRVLRLPSSFYRRFATGDLVARTDALTQIRQRVSGSGITAFVTLVFSVFNVALVFAYSTVLGAFVLLVLAVTLGVLGVVARRATRHQREAFNRRGEAMSELYQIVQAMGKVRIDRAEARVMTRWATLFRLQQRQYNETGRLDALVAALTAALPATLMLVVFGVGATLLRGHLSGGAFVALVTALGQFTAALTVFAAMTSTLVEIIPLWQRAMPLLEASLEEEGHQVPGPLAGRVSVRNLTFAYGPDEAPVLQDLSIDVPAGSLVALTGPSGAGKSTLIRLLLGLEVPDGGIVLYDGKDLRFLDRHHVRRQCGVVLQEARPLPGDVLSVIVGDTGAGEEEAWAAAEAAALADDIRALPRGMHTLVGGGAMAFSGGQIQRLMIARAIARRPRIFLLDEATSALDDLTQARVVKALGQLDVTRIVVAHRLSTIRDADRIYVLDRGRVAQAGTYEELMAEDGHFRLLAARQTL